MSLSRWGAVALAAAVLTAIAGCGGDSDSAAKAPVAAPSTGPDAGPASSSPGGTAGTPATGATGGPTSEPTGGAESAGGSGGGKTPVAESARCHSVGLKVVVTGYDSGAGQRFARLVFTNTTGKSCRMSGFPGLRLGNTSEGFDTEVVRQGSASTVTVPAGGTAHTQLRWSAVPAADETGAQCQPTATVLQVFPPDETNPMVAVWSGGPACQHNRLETSAIKAGAGA